MADKIQRLIVNSPYSEPQKYHEYLPESKSFVLRTGRRRAGYLVASSSSRAYDDPGRFMEIALVNKIRPRVKAWREAGYAGTSATTRRLLAHWNSNDEGSGYRLFFCQLEAIETLIWLLEAPASERVGIEIPSDGGAFQRLCTKMATGSGKTIVMAMLIAWQILNKVSAPQDKRFSKNVFVVAPGLTVKNRLAVLNPQAEGNYYAEFNLIPSSLLDQLRQGEVLVVNWHSLQWENNLEKLKKVKSVDKRKRQPISNEAYVRKVLGTLARTRNLLVINDEAHHAWRILAGANTRGIDKEAVDEATKWIGGLDRIHQTRGILRCYDFSATPFIPSGKRASEEALFSWIVSDFGLNDAIESGLVKTPRIVVRSDTQIDAESFKSKLYHLYQHIKDDLNRKAEAHESLPDLLLNAYYLLGSDWQQSAQQWREAGQQMPPVMITVANSTYTAARVELAFHQGRIQIDELIAEPKQTLRIDSKVLSEAEASIAGQSSEKELLSQKEQAEALRHQVDTVGQVGESGEQIRHVISVGMLTEGWDAKTVTHIMGLRAFTSQLLCEQVVGRGLRRASYEIDDASGLLAPEYVNIFGVPFSFLPHESGGDGIPTPPAPKTRIAPDADKRTYALHWPNVLRVNHPLRYQLVLDVAAMETLELSATDTILEAELAQVVAGKPNLEQLNAIDMRQLGEKLRYQEVIFRAARDLYQQSQPDWKGGKPELLAQVVRLIEQFIAADKLAIEPSYFAADPVGKRLLLTLNMSKLVQHIWQAIRQQSSHGIEAVLDTEKPWRSTADMQPWYSGKPCAYTKKSHINFCVCDSTWEDSAGYLLDHSKRVKAWAKNDHLGLRIYYLHQGIVKAYYPDYVLHLHSGDYIILEIKGRSSAQVKEKELAAKEWVNAVNQLDNGHWHYALCYSLDELRELLNSKQANHK